MAPRDAEFYINELQLKKHVEGGYYLETYRSAIELPRQSLSRNFAGSRSASTCIYFLLELGQFSAFHKISSDEIWHFYDGDPLDIFEIGEDGNLVTHKLGRDISNGERLQVVIPAGRWFGSRVAGSGTFSLVGCTVAPGFDFADFILADRHKLTTLYPALHALIAEMTYT